MAWLRSTNARRIVDMKTFPGSLLLLADEFRERALPTLYLNPCPLGNVLSYGSWI